MKRPMTSASKAGGKSSAGKSKGLPQATPPGKALKPGELDELSAGKPLAERATKEPWPPCDTDAEDM